MVVAPTESFRDRLKRRANYLVVGTCLMLCSITGTTGQNPSTSNRLFPAGDEPDVVLDCHSYNDITIDSWKNHTASEWLAHLSREALATLLRSIKTKDRILFWLDKSIDWQSPATENQLLDFENFVGSLGFRRTIVLGARAFSMPVIFDSARGGHIKSEERTEPVIIFPVSKNGRSTIETVEPDYNEMTILNCYGWNKICIESCPTPFAGLVPSDASRYQVKEFLQQIPKRKSILIWIAKGTDWWTPAGQEKLKEFEKYALELGFEYTEIKGATAWRSPVLFDSTRGGHQELRQIETPPLKAH